jgi:F-type H+-transporting ATPase subunit epsilon
MADSSLFTINLVTPERVLVTGQATEVILRTGDGDITFLAGHTPLVGTVEPGVVRVVRAEGDEERVATHGGFVQVEQKVEDEDGPATSGTRVTLLIGVAELAEEIDVDRARAALEAAESRVAELGGAGGRTGAGAATSGGETEEPDAELVEAQAELLRAQVRLETVDVTSGATSGSGAAAG